LANASGSSSRSLHGASSQVSLNSHPILISPADQKAAEAEAAAAATTIDETAPANSGSSSGSSSSSSSAAAAALSPSRRRLTQVDARSHFSAELRLPQISIYIPDGVLLMPAEVRSVNPPAAPPGPPPGQQQQQQQHHHHHLPHQKTCTDVPVPAALGLKDFPPASCSP
jgi:hypothetical protein